jgi:phage terminase large subunit-like protein
MTAPSMDALFSIFDQMPPEVLQQAARQIPRELERRTAERKLELYRPYTRQAEFHAAGAQYRERLLSAANQVGKTLCAGAEVAMHVTQRYPSWWEGRTFNKPLPWWVAGITAESTRDNPQRILLGRVGQWGTGMLPKDAIVGEPTRKRTIADAIDMVTVRYGGGGDIQAGESSIAFKAYDQGREKFQGETLGGVWLDEECDREIYSECLTRTSVGLGPVLMTFTPLLGVTAVVRRFLIEKVEGTHVTNMTIEDAEHFSPEERRAIVAAYPEHEREARSKGIPMRGSGAVFPIGMDHLLCQSFPIPDHWAHICGIDFGWSHPSAGVRLAFDRDSDVLYVIAAHRAKEQTPLLFAGAVKPWGDWLPWAWPHDGHQSGGKFDAKDQEQLAAMYRRHGLRMLFQHATFDDGTNGLEAGIAEMLERMQTGRLKVFSELREWQEEFSLYHRKDGVIVKEHDDLMSATRYALMMRRFAKTRRESKPKTTESFESDGGYAYRGEHAWMA